MELYESISKNFFKFKEVCTKILNACIDFFWSWPINLIIVVLGIIVYLPYALFKNQAFIKTDIIPGKVIKIDEYISKNPLISQIVFTISHMPVVLLMLLEPAKAAIALGLTINTGGNLLYNFKELLESDYDSLRNIVEIKCEITRKLSHGGTITKLTVTAYNKIFPEKKETPSWTAIENAWKKETYTDLIDQRKKTLIPNL